jgi:hypothetical protein
LERSIADQCGFGTLWPEKQRGSSVERKYLPVVPVKHVNERYYPGMFGDFEETVTKHLAELKAEGSWQSEEKTRFFEHLLERIDHDRYRELRDTYLFPPKIESSALKYLDPVSWFEHKFRFVFRLGLHKAPPMRILDLGTGAGHFLVIADFYGHTALGTEIPDHLHPEGQTHLYNALAEVYGTNRVKHRIAPFTPLHELAGEYDLVTAFSAAFNLARGGRLWGRSAWDFFLSSLREQVLVENGAFFLMMVRQKSRDEIWDYLTSLAEWNEERELLLYMNASALPHYEPAHTISGVSPDESGHGAHAVHDAVHPEADA